jgi:hypothetical protein
MREHSSSVSRSDSNPAASRRRFLGVASGGLLVLWGDVAAAQEGVFLRAEDAPRALFPDADETQEMRVASSAELRQRIRGTLGRIQPSLWEDEYRIFSVTRAGGLLGYVVIVEEIGKHRPITFAVGVSPDGPVTDVALLTYREPYGGEIRHRRFLAQYRGKSLTDPLLPYRDIRNITGATLSVEATGRAVRKAVAVLKASGKLS